MYVAKVTSYRAAYDLTSYISPSQQKSFPKWLYNTFRILIFFNKASKSRLAFGPSPYY